MPKLTISLAQMQIAPGNLRRNMDTMQALVVEAARRGSQLIVLPELWPSGYALEQIGELASPLNGGIFAQVSTIAKENKICIAGSMPEQRGDGINNSAAFFAPNGHVLGVYRKIHLFRLMEEDRYLQPGQSPLNIDLPWGTTGMAICYDLRFPEMFRRYGVNGSKLVLLPAQWPAARIAHWRTLIQARAIENQYFMAACNSTGESQENGRTTLYGGHSMIVDPWGETVIEAGTMPGLYTAEIELALADEVRERIPVFEDRRPDTYGLDDIMSRLDF
jgi:predicted amidohydrolase